MKCCKGSLGSLPFLVAACFLLTVQMGLVGQKRDDQGEALGVPGRVKWSMKAPSGMVFIPGGSFTTGNVDQDLASRVTPSRQVTVSSFYMDEHAVTNNQYRQFIEALLEEAETLQEEQRGNDSEEDVVPSVVDSRVSEEGDLSDVLSEEFVMQKLYPDMKRWKEDFSHHMADPMVDEYFEHVAFDNFPVVGVTWDAARYFAEWRTRYLNEYREKKGLWPMPKFRLPTAAEWTYAAIGGREFSKYPWGGPYVRDAEGKLLANFKSNRGGYRECKYDYTAPVDFFPRNGYGLHIGGNVSEWTLDSYNPAAPVRAWDLNPVYLDEGQDVKVVKGGSWKDIALFLETGRVDYEHRERARSFIGFRCAMPHIGEDPNY